MQALVQRFIADAQIDDDGRFDKAEGNAEEKERGDNAQEAARRSVANLRNGDLLYLEIAATA
jgi:hypothetical protein